MLESLPHLPEADLRIRDQEAARRVRERREEEDAAPRLREVASALRELSIKVRDQGETGALAGTEYVRHVVVAHAPALFVIPCTDATCVGGGHDVTADVLTALRRRDAEFTGEHACRGTRGTVACGRVMRYVAKATYSDD